jgi:hypothetical protein
VSDETDTRPALLSRLTYFDQPSVAACDARCDKAWGINSRPTGADGGWLADSELGRAPADPGTYEGGDAKPRRVPMVHNRWCVRECERCVLVPLGDDVCLPDFSQRIYP